MAEKFTMRVMVEGSKGYELPIVLHGGEFQVGSPKDEPATVNTPYLIEAVQAVFWQMGTRVKGISLTPCE